MIEARRRFVSIPWRRPAPAGIRLGRLAGFFLFSFLLASTWGVWAEQLVGIDELNDNPDAYIGKNVTVRGEVKSFLGKGLITLEEEGIFGENLLVILQEPLPPASAPGGEVPATRDDFVQVTGTVQRYVAAEVERELGIDLDPEIETEIEENRPVLIAKSITRPPRTSD